MGLKCINYAIKIDIDGSSLDKVFKFGRILSLNAIIRDFKWLYKCKYKDIYLRLL